LPAECDSRPEQRTGARAPRPFDQAGGGGVQHVDPVDAAVRTDRGNADVIVAGQVGVGHRVPFVGVRLRASIARGPRGVNARTILDRPRGPEYVEAGPPGPRRRPYLIVEQPCSTLPRRREPSLDREGTRPRRVPYHGAARAPPSGRSSGTIPRQIRRGSVWIRR